MLSLQAIDKNVAAEIDSQDKLAGMKLKRLKSKLNPDYRWRTRDFRIVVGVASALAEVTDRSMRPMRQASPVYRRSMAIEL
jgi:hypothetical protein